MWLVTVVSCCLMHSKYSLTTWFAHLSLRHLSSCIPQHCLQTPPHQHLSHHHNILSYIQDLTSITGWPDCIKYVKIQHSDYAVIHCIKTYQKSAHDGIWLSTDAGQSILDGCRCIAISRSKLLRTPYSLIILPKTPTDTILFSKNTAIIHQANFCQWPNTNMCFISEQ